MTDKEKFRLGHKGDPEIKPITVNKTTSLKTDEEIEHHDVFRPKPILGKRLKPIHGKRFRIPRKAKKFLKTRMCKSHRMKPKKLKFSYRKINLLNK